VRANVSELMRTHKALASTSPQLRLREELVISCDYALFLMLCQCIALLIWARGPIELGRVIGFAEELSGRIAEVVTGLIPAESAAGNNKVEAGPIVGPTKG
jgi:hypothetical protein